MLALRIEQDVLSSLFSNGYRYDARIHWFKKRGIEFPPLAVRRSRQDEWLSRRMGTLGAEIVEIKAPWCSHIYRYRDLT